MRWEGQRLLSLSSHIIRPHAAYTDTRPQPKQTITRPHSSALVVVTESLGETDGTLLLLMTHGDPKLRPRNGSLTRAICKFCTHKK